MEDGECGKEMMAASSTTVVGAVGGRRGIGQNDGRDNIRNDDRKVGDWERESSSETVASDRVCLVLFRVLVTQEYLEVGSEVVVEGLEGGISE